MTLKQLKERVRPGTKLVLVNCLMGPCRKARTVETVNTVGFAATGDGLQSGRLSYCGWPKAKDLEATEKGFRIWEEGYGGRPREIAVEYEWA